MSRTTRTLVNFPPQKASLCGPTMSHSPCKTAGRGVWGDRICSLGRKITFGRYRTLEFESRRGVQRAPLPLGPVVRCPRGG